MASFAGGPLVDFIQYICQKKLSSSELQKNIYYFIFVLVLGVSEKEIQLIMLSHFLKKRHSILSGFTVRTL
jgi:hypothetical protein